MTETVKLAGPAGSGIKSSGQILAKCLISHGLNVIDYNEYPSLVRGGHNTYQCSFSGKQIFSIHQKVDYFFSVKPGHWQQHLDEIHPKSLIFSDEKSAKLKAGTFLNLPLSDLSKEAGSVLTTNTICLGVLCFLLNLNKESLLLQIENQYPKFRDINAKAFNLGFEHAANNYSSYQEKNKQSIKSNLSPMLNDGNESFGWGFLKGGGDFYSAYPMTPATGTLHFLAEKQKEFNIKVLHPEDEIAVANMAAGASIAGARTAVGTSGGGFALMNEVVSFCGIAEIGMVFYLVSRPGPATGLPTWTSQGDLLHAIHSGHGEFPKVVLAPGDWQESFEMATQALNLADILQTPVIVISDKLLGESSRNTPAFPAQKLKIDRGKITTKPNENYQRYAFSSSGISKRSLPGTEGGEFLSNSYEHDETGFATEDPIVATKMMEKRAQKLQTAIKHSPKANVFGTNKAKKLIISWGSTKGPILEALNMMKNSKDYCFLQLRTLWPINPDLKFIIDSFKTKIVIENNQNSQLTTLLKSQFDFNPDIKILKFDGRPFYPEEIYEQLKSI